MPRVLAARGTVALLGVPEGDLDELYLGHRRTPPSWFPYLQNCHQRFLRRRALAWRDAAWSRVSGRVKPKPHEGHRQDASPGIRPIACSRTSSDPAGSVRVPQRLQEGNIGLPHHSSGPQPVRQARPRALGRPERHAGVERSLKQAHELTGQRAVPVELEGASGASARGSDVPGTECHHAAHRQRGGRRPPLARPGTQHVPGGVGPRLDVRDGGEESVHPGGRRLRHLPASLEQRRPSGELSRSPQGCRVEPDPEVLQGEDHLDVSDAAMRRPAGRCHLSQHIDDLAVFGPSLPRRPPFQRRRGGVPGPPPQARHPRVEAVIEHAQREVLGGPDPPCVRGVLVQDECLVEYLEPEERVFLQQPEQCLASGAV